MENMEDFCVSHHYTQRDLLILSPSTSSSFSAAADGHLLLRRCRRSGSHSVQISPKTRYKQTQNETHYENITH
jgi:hypothetical protein